MKSDNISGAIQIPDEPTIKYPKWLHRDICGYIQWYIKNAIYYKHAPLGIELGIYSNLTNTFNKIKPALVNPQMEQIWITLHKENPEKSLKLVYCLLQIENDFDHGLGLRIKHINELKSAKKMSQLTQSLIDAMEDNCNYYGHMQTENFNTIYESLKNFKCKTDEMIDDFKGQISERDYLFCQHWPIGRKHDAENSLAIFFIRKLYHFFSVEFSSPKYSVIEKIVNIIFDTSYTENHIIKYTASMRELTCDDSIEK